MPGPVTAERANVSRRPAPIAPAFTGRDRELAALTAGLADVPAVVLVEGEAGIGKTRLIAEFAASPAGQARKILMGACPPLREPHTLGVVTQAIRGAVSSLSGLRLSALAGALRPLFPEWAHDLPPMPAPVEDATATRNRLYAALAELLDRLEITALIAEDVHWADEATLEFLLFLACGQPCRVSLVVTLRPEEIPAGTLLPRLARLAAGDRGLRIALGPLDATATASLVASMLGGREVPGELAAIVHRQSEGVPLLAEELVRLMADRAVFAEANGQIGRIDDVGVPPAVRDVVLERAEGLSPEARAVLQAAAVLDTAASERVITAVAALPPERGQAGLCEALACSLLAEDRHGAVSFRHRLACQAVYEAIPGPARRELHLRCGRALEAMTPPPAAELARHFREAGDIARWRAYAVQAVETALAAGDEMTVIIVLSELIADADLPARRAAALVDQLTLASLTDLARYHDLVGALRLLLERTTGDSREKAEARFQLGRLLRLMDDYERGNAELERAVPDLAHAPALAARAMAMLGWAHCLTITSRSAHLRWLRRAADLSPALGPTDRTNLLVLRATALLLLGAEEGWSAAAQIPADAPAPAERYLITVGHINAGDMAMVWGRYPQARQHLATALDLAEAHQYHRYRELILTTQAHLDWFTGSWAGLAERLRVLADDTETVPGARIEADLVTGLLAGAVGAGAEAEERIGRVLAEHCQRGQAVNAAESAAALARLLLAGNRVGEALRVTDEPLAIVTGKGTWVWAADLAPARVQALLAAGRAEEAAGLVAAFSGGLRGRGAPAPQAGVIMCRALLAEARSQHGRAAALFDRASCAWQALPRPYDALLARERHAHCLLAAGSAGAGLSVLADVLRGLSRLGAATAAARVARTLRENGTQVRRPGAGRPSYGNQLSPRELDVVRLLVQGGTNRDIARQLFLSPNTVTRHLGSAMRKLHVTSRAALAARVTEDGILTAERLASAGDPVHG